MQQNKTSAIFTPERPEITYQSFMRNFEEQLQRAYPIQRCAALEKSTRKYHHQTNSRTLERNEYENDYQYDNCYLKITTYLYDPLLG